MGDYTLTLSTNVHGLSPVDFNQYSNNQSLFSSPETSPRNMQDESKGHPDMPESSSEDEKKTIDSLPLKVDVTEPDTLRTDVCNVSSVANSVASSVRNNFTDATSIVTSLASLAATVPSSNGQVWTGNHSMGMATVDDTFLQGLQSLNGTVTFQNYSPNSMFNNMNTLNTQNLPAQLQQLGMSNVNQLNVASSSQSRRPITGQNPHHNFPRQQPFFKGGYNPGSWGNAMNVHNSWPVHQQQTLPNMGNGHHPSHYKPRSVPNPNISAQFRKQGLHNSPQTVMFPSKFKRSTSYPGNIVPSVEDSPNMKDASQLLSTVNQERGGPSSNGFDSMRFPMLENHLLDIMRHTHTAESTDFKGKSPFGNIDESHLLDDGSLDQTVPNMTSPIRGSPNSQSQNSMERIEKYSRKVFVGGLPPDIDEEEITAAFRRFGPVVVDWPHKAESKSYFPPKGYCFLLFQDELSVQALVDVCIMDDSKLYWCVSSPTMKDKPVQIRPWSISDSDFVMDGSQTLDPRKTIFVGGVPRPLRAVELAMIMDRLYGGVCYAGIDTDPELKYPKGAGRVAFSNQQSYIAAISARFVQLQHADIDKRVEVKPYVLDDQMCDECAGSRCGGKFAPFFCANITCLQYYCEHCWAQIHQRPGREFHKPLVKEGADRPRSVPFRWC